MGIFDKLFGKKKQPPPPSKPRAIEKVYILAQGRQATRNEFESALNHPQVKPTLDALDQQVGGQPGEWDLTEGHPEGIVIAGLAMQFSQMHSGRGIHIAALEDTSPKLLVVFVTPKGTHLPHLKTVAAANTGT